MKGYTTPCLAHLLVGDQKQAHQRGVEDRLRDVGRLPLDAVLGHQGSTQGLTGALHVDATGSRHSCFTGKPQKRLPESDPQTDRTGLPREMKAPPQLFHTRGQRRAESDGRS